MTLAYSISTGIAMGFIVFVVVKIAKKKVNELTPILIIATLLFILNYILSALL
jgi:AGZA family xanthine/uracil permease-like MFS transporter